MVRGALTNYSRQHANGPREAKAAVEPAECPHTESPIERRCSRVAEVMTKAKIEQLAPDQASLGAALNLVKPASRPMLARQASRVGGRYSGSASLSRSLW